MIIKVILSFQSVFVILGYLAYLSPQMLDLLYNSTRKTERGAWKLPIGESPYKTPCRAKWLETLGSSEMGRAAYERCPGTRNEGLLRLEVGQYRGKVVSQRHHSFTGSLLG